MAAQRSVAGVGPATVTSFDGAELHVEITGPVGTVEPSATVGATGPAADALTVVLAHGWALDNRSWRAVADVLAATPGVRVLRYDQRGHGRSTRGTAWLEGVDHAFYG